MIPVSLGSDGMQYFILLGGAWRRDSDLGAGATVDVELSPEGPQTETIAEDIPAALSQEPEARAFFEALTTFFRINFIRWIEDTKQPAIRAARIIEMIGLLKASKKQIRWGS